MKVDYEMVGIVAFFVAVFSVVCSFYFAVSFITFLILEYYR